MSLFHTHNFEILSAYDREKILFPSVLATPGTAEEEYETVEVTDVIQQCTECKALRDMEFKGHHAEALASRKVKVEPAKKKESSSKGDSKK